MKIFLASAIVFCLALSSLYGSHVSIRQDDREDIVQFMKDNRNQIGYLLANYEIEGVKPNIAFDYHLGYLNGRYAAYSEILDRINE